MNGHYYVKSIIFSCITLPLFITAMERSVPLDLILAITADIWQEEPLPRNDQAMPVPELELKKIQEEAAELKTLKEKEEPYLQNNPLCNPQADVPVNHATQNSSESKSWFARFFNF